MRHKQSIAELIRQYIMVHFYGRLPSMMLAVELSKTVAGSAGFDRNGKLAELNLEMAVVGRVFWNTLPPAEARDYVLYLFAEKPKDENGGFIIPTPKNYQIRHIMRRCRIKERQA